MWKKIGSVHSGDARSNRSSVSKEEVKFESYRQQVKTKSMMSDHSAEKGLCQEYLNKKRRNCKNMTFNLGSKSQKNSNSVLAKGQDMFTSMRNVLGTAQEENLSRKNSKKESILLANNFSQRNREFKVKKSEISKEFKDLKKTHKNLNSTVKKQLQEMKNMLEEIQQKAGQSSKKAVNPESGYNGIKNFSDDSMIENLLSEATQLDWFFSEMDSQKAAVMRKYNI